MVRHSLPDPWRLELHTEPVGDAVHESNVGDDCTSIVNAAVIKACRPKAADVRRRDLARRERQSVGVGQKSALAHLQRHAFERTGGKEPSAAS